MSRLSQTGVGYPLSPNIQGPGPKIPQGIGSNGAGTNGNPLAVSLSTTYPHMRQRAITVDMSVAHNGTLIDQGGGDAIMVIANTSAKVLSLALDNSSNGPVPYYVGQGFDQTRFDSLYITNVAGNAGDVATIWIMETYYPGV